MNGYNNYSDDTLVVNSTTSTTINLRPTIATYSVTVTVTDQGGTAINGASVTLVGGSVNSTLTSDPDGKVTFPGIAAGNYTASASMSGYVFNSDSFTVGTESVSIKLTATPQ